MLVTSAPLAENTGFSGVKIAVDAELLHEPAFLGLRVVAAAGHRAGMADGARELALPAPDHAGDHRLGELRVELVVAARLAVQHRGLAARVVGEREGELGRRVVDVDVLAAGDRPSSCPSPPCAGTARWWWRSRPSWRRSRSSPCAASPGLSPPSAPPMRTWFQASATPRPLAPKMSMPFCWPIARISRASCTEIFSVTMKIFFSSGLTRISSATPSRAADGGR